jgi:broad specificity phosphatase PhoE
MKQIYLYLIRHTQSETNASKLPDKDNLFYDPNLTSLGIEQASMGAKFLSTFFLKKPFIFISAIASQVVTADLLALT